MLKHAFWLLAAVALSAAAQDGPGSRPSELNGIDFLVGKWTLSSEASSPDGTMEKSTGTMTGTWILGKRHVQMIQSQKTMGMDVEGALMLSWDEKKEQYISTWFDSTTGHPMLGWGPMKDGKLTTTTEEIDFGPEMGGKMRIKMDLVKKSNDAFTLTVYGGAEGNWMQFFKADYSRRK